MIRFLIYFWVDENVSFIGIMCAYSVKKHKIFNYLRVAYIFIIESFSCKLKRLNYFVKLAFFASYLSFLLFTISGMSVLIPNFISLINLFKKNSLSTPIVTNIFDWEKREILLIIIIVLQVYKMLDDRTQNSF